ncbi:MAG: glycosyltransferase family 2 protein, partial [Waterburya sp.]
MSNQSPKVTIVIRTHNCEKFVEQAVFSVVTQDYPNLEVVVLDDASSDRTPEILEKLKKEYPQLILHRHFTKTKDSQIKRMHQELTKSDAKYLGWVDGDDILLPGA